MIAVGISAITKLLVKLIAIMNGLKTLEIQTIHDGYVHAAMGIGGGNMNTSAEKLKLVK